MTDKHLHIIAFNTPYPASYGGVIDIFYKIKSLHELGVKIHLHCFEYGRQRASELNKICASVHYYKRKSGLQYIVSSLPYIVVTRQSQELLNNLLKDNYPILFEGLHACYHLSDSRLNDRLTIVRTHNIEHDYYNALARTERSLLKRLYLTSEAKKLKSFENILNRATNIIAISPADTKNLAARYKNVTHVGPFHPDCEVNSLPGKGNFALYHGNLEVGENIDAALFLINEVFNYSNIPLIIAGQMPPSHLSEAASKHKNVEIKANISTSQIYELIKQAQINVLPTFQPTGIKLKLLAALFNGRHCVVNSPMVANTQLEDLCHVHDSAAEMKQAIGKLFILPFEINDSEKRKETLLKFYDNKVTAQKIVDLLSSS